MTIVDPIPSEISDAIVSLDGFAPGYDEICSIWTVMGVCDFGNLRLDTIDGEVLIEWRKDNGKVKASFTRVEKFP